MLIKIKKDWEIDESEITPESTYLNRRQFIKSGTGMVGAYIANPLFKNIDSDKKLTKENLALEYNNFYEFSLDKAEVSKKVKTWNLNPADWKIEVAGLVEKQQKFYLGDLIKLGGSEEERIYRFRCVEAWSMVLPWGGVPLEKIIKNLGPKKNAKYVVFQSFSDKNIGKNMTDLPHYPWPYQEGLTLEEALNPLAFMATGLYGKPIAKQSGAPMRLVVPWKYGFKSIKSIVKIEFTDSKPKTLWNELAPKEYGFYANVNPAVDHPRWTQSVERVIDGKFFPTRIPTKMFNGYGSEVEHLYKGLDLAVNF